MPSPLTRKPLPSYPKSISPGAAETQPAAQSGQPPKTNGTNATITAEPTLQCRQCGAGVELETEDWAVLSEAAKARIEELEGEVKILTGKASVAGELLKPWISFFRKLQSSNRACAFNAPMTLTDWPHPLQLTNWRTMKTRYRS